MITRALHWRESWRLLRITQYADNSFRTIRENILPSISVAPIALTAPMSIDIVASPRRFSSS